MYMDSQKRFLRAPGTVRTLRCAACGEVCAVERGVKVTLDWGPGMAKQTNIYDVFTCQWRDEPWHEQAATLKEAIAEAPGERQAAQLQNSLDALLAAVRPVNPA
jgi:hypothetical protein